LTDVLPSGESFVAFGSSPAGTSASQNGQNLQWVLPALAPGNYTVGYSVEVAGLVAGGQVLTNAVTLTSPNFPLETASVGVTTTGSYTVKIGVYNEAGELVKEIAVEQFSQGVQAIQLSPNATIQNLEGKIQIYDNGYLLGAWDGTDNSGNPVSNGGYYIKVDSIDPLGVDTSLTQEAVVSRSLAKVEVDIYNEAGEVVRRLYGAADDPNGASMTNVALSSSVLATNTSSSGAQSQVQILIQGSGAPLTLVWDGKDDSGQVVTSGRYLMEVHWDNGQGAVSDITRGIQVEDGGNRPGVIVEPNILAVSQGVKTANFLSNDPNVQSLNVSVYTVAGERVTEKVGTPGSGRVSWDADGVASGVYLAVVETLNGSGQITGRQIVKVLVER
jgi:flagellar hook assembly protein FlgD